MATERSYLVCATPRSGSTLVCQALKETGVAGRPEEYFEALQRSGRPRRPAEYFTRAEDPSILDHLGERERRAGEEPEPRSPLWSRTAYDRYLQWVMEQGTTPNGVFGAKLMWGYFGDFVSLLRNIPAYRDLPLTELLPSVFPELTFVRVVRANKVRQAVSLWKAVQTATWRQEDPRWDQRGVAALPEDSDVPPYKSFLEEHRPALRFHYGAISHLLDQILREEARWDAFFEHTRIKPVLVLYENFAADYETSTLNVLERLGLSAPEGFKPEPRMKRQADGINDDWARRYSDLRLGSEFDLVPVVPDPETATERSFQR
ncbi:MAG: Stf0 family sulfotransferase [Solirubrobacterales bacterium]